MTVTYTAEVATCRGFGCFLKLLSRWRGSIYKLVWLDLIAFTFIYYSLNFSYRFLMDQEKQKTFEKVVRYCSEYGNLIPLSFVLGFYVSIVMTRWWNQYITMPWPDSIAVFVSAHLHGQDDRGRVMRRTIMRYVCLCLTMVLTMISPRVKKRFPTLDHFVEAGLLVENEKCIIEDLNKQFPLHRKHWLPIVWASSIVTRARKEGRIRDDFAVKTLIDEFNKFRGQAGLLLTYDTVSIPLVYTQVVTLAVYSYFLTSSIARQWINDPDNKKGNIDLYFPFFTVLEFFFYMGWLKVAESLINPWGDDDDDFEVNWIVDRNLQISYIIVDEMHHEHPELIKDQYWDQVFPSELPYTVAAEPFRESQPLPSTAKIDKITRQDSFFRHSFKADDMEMDDDASGIHFTAKDRKSRPNSMYSRQASSSSQTSMNATGGASMTRTNSISGVLKKIFSREDTRVDRTDSLRLPGSASSASLRERPSGMTGSMRITDPIIEEADEQLTITSMRQPEKRPTVINLFGPPPPSEPVNIPGSAPKQQISSSAPAATTQEIIEGEPSTSSVTSEDEFLKLKASRDIERQERVLQRLVRSISVEEADDPPHLHDREALINMQPLNVAFTKSGNA